MSGPEWLKWIKPAPKDAGELAIIAEAVEGLIEDVWDDIDNCTTGPQYYSSLGKISKHLNIATDLLLNTKTVRLSFDSIKVDTWMNEIMKVNQEISEITSEINTESTGKPRARGRRPEDNKAFCVYCSRAMLIEMGKKHGMHRTGPVVALAKWAWVQAGGDDMSTVSAWGAIAEGVVKMLKEDQEMACEGLN